MEYRGFPRIRGGHTGGFLTASPLVALPRSGPRSEPSQTRRPSSCVSFAAQPATIATLNCHAAEDNFTAAISILEVAMIYSNACGYAIQALSRLALMRPDGYLLMEDLCKDSNLPRHFIAKIFQDLVRQGLVISAKGRGGGFALARPAEQITVYDIVAVVDGMDQFDACVVALAQCDEHQLCPQHDQFRPIRQRVKKFLVETTLERMARTLQKKLSLTGQFLPEPQSASKPLRTREGRLPVGGS